MRIAIDARSLEGQKLGVGRYLANLLDQWSDIAPHHEYFLYFKRSIPCEEFLDRPCFKKKVLKEGLLGRSYWVWEQICLPLELSRGKFDLLFSPSYTAPFFTNCKTTVVLHDVSYETRPDWFPPVDRFFLRALSKSAVKRATVVLTVSEFSRREIVKHYNIAREKVKVVLEASDPKFKPVGDLFRLSEVKQKYGLPNKFVLYVGKIFTRRNIPKLLEAFRELVFGLGVECKLVLVGGNGTYPRQDIGEIINGLGLWNKVIWLDFVPEEDLILLYNAANLFIYPSSYEGFGLPILEAMACGTPVITSNRSCLPEVAGDAALLVDPENEHELAQAMQKLLLDERLQETLRGKGLARARSFSWRTAAQEILHVFEEL